MRLIDADELIKSYLDHNRTEFEIKNCCMANENVIAIIDNAPAVEQRPQGEWKTNLTTGDIFCSCCKEVRRDTRIKHINFCNSCGAKMQKGGAE